MKISLYLPGLIGCLILTISAQAQNKPGVDSTGLPGDNFSLQGALAMFQQEQRPVLQGLVVMERRKRELPLQPPEVAGPKQLSEDISQ